MRNLKKRKRKRSTSNRKRSRVGKRRLPIQPPLRFTRYAWAKLNYLRDVGDTEIGGFGISTPSDLLLVEDFVMPRQQCDWAQVEFEDDSVADLFDQQVDLGRSPEQFGRIWIHTHPGESASPSRTDEETFVRVFGDTQWAAMMILASGGATTSRLQFNVGPKGQMQLPVEIDRQTDCQTLDPALWLAEYRRCVKRLVLPEPGLLIDDPWLAYEAWRWNLATELEEVADEQF